MKKEYVERNALIAELNRVYKLLEGFHPQFYAGFQFAIKIVRAFSEDGGGKSERDSFPRETSR